MHLNFSLLSPGPTYAQHLAAVRRNILYSPAHRTRPLTTLVRVCGQAGYKVAVFGKYLNRIPVHPNGRPQIPTGVSTWFVSPGDEANKSSRLDASGE